MNLAFLGLLVGGLVLSLVNPSLLPWVLIGASLGMSPRMLRALKSRANRPNARYQLPKGKARLWIAAASVGMVVTALAVTAAYDEEEPIEHGTSPVLRIPEVEGTYVARPTLGGDPERFRIEDEFEIAEDTIETTAQEMAESDPRSVPEIEAELKRRIRHVLTSDRWRETPPTTAAMTFTRVRRQEVQLPRIRAQQANTLKTPRDFGSRISGPGGRDRRRRARNRAVSTSIALPASDASRMVVTAEKNAIGDTYPEGKTESRQSEDLSVTRIPLRESGNEIELQVRRPLFRNGFLAAVAVFTTSGFLKWFLLIGIAFAEDEIKALLKRLLSRLVGRPAKGET